jgi:CubicO group peptidase (beta-lactamase class C family)
MSTDDPVAAWIKRIDEAEVTVRALLDHPDVGVSGMTTMAVWVAIEAVQKIKLTFTYYSPRVLLDAPAPTSQEQQT